MKSMGRRSVLRTTLGLAAAGTLGRPYIANAQAKTAIVWVNQGFIPQEDAACNKLVADYMKASGNKIDLSIMPFMAQNQKNDLGTDQRRCPRSGLHGRSREYPAAERLGRQNRGRDRRRHALRVTTDRDRKGRFDLLQQGDETAQLLPVSDQAGLRPVPHLGQLGRVRPAISCRMPRTHGTHSGTSSSRCRPNCVTRGCAICMPVVFR